MGSSASAAVVSLVVEGTITREWEGAFPTADLGDSFRLSVTYSDTAVDSNASPEMGSYALPNMQTRLEILGEGVLVTGVGGSLSVSTVPGMVMGPDGSFPTAAYNFVLNVPGDRFAVLSFRDDDRSMVDDDGIPTRFGDVNLYDEVSFSIVAIPMFDPAPDLRLEGNVTRIIPEPTVLGLLALGGLGLVRRRRG